VWNAECQAAFAALKDAMVGPSVVALARLDDLRGEPFRLTTDASDYAMGAVLEQLHKEDGRWHAVAYSSRKFSPAELNYSSNDKEVLAGIGAMLKWRHYLGSAHFTLVTDNRGLQYLLTKRTLLRRQARWLETLAEFDYVVEHRPGKLLGPADLLSRRPDLALNLVDQEMHAVTTAAITVNVECSAEFLQRVQGGLKTDIFFGPVVRQLEEVKPQAELHHFRRLYELRQGLLYLRADDRLCVPDGFTTELMTTFHDGATQGHPGRSGLYSILRRLFFWRNMFRMVGLFVRSCDLCQRVKSRNHPVAGLPQPLELPAGRWTDISLDFVTDLPTTEDSFNAILTVTDRFSKRVHFIPCVKAITAVGTATLLLKHVIAYHGWPQSITSDRDPRFCSNVWTALFEQSGTKLKMSTAAHPQTDGASERANRTVQTYLRAFVNFRQTSWDRLLPLAELAINSRPNTVTKMSPFKLDLGREIVTPETWLNPSELARGQSSVGDLVQQQKLDFAVAQDCILLAQHMDAARVSGVRLPAPFNVGDRVMVHSDFLMTAEERLRPKRKLRHRYLGPFVVLKRIGNVAYRLQLPQECRAHPVFNVNALKPYVPNNLEGRMVPPTVSQEHAQFVTRAILGYRRQRGVHQFLVDWEGFPPSERTWEPLSVLIIGARVNRHLLQFLDVHRRINALVDHLLP